MFPAAKESRECELQHRVPPDVPFQGSPPTRTTEKGSLTAFKQASPIGSTSFPPNLEGYSVQGSAEFHASPDTQVLIANLRKNIFLHYKFSYKNYNTFRKNIK